MVFIFRIYVNYIGFFCRKFLLKWFLFFVVLGIKDFFSFVLDKIKDLMSVVNGLESELKGSINFIIGWDD